jgi:hypothetical protein
MNTLLKKIIRSGVGRFRYIVAMLGMGTAVFFILLAVQTHANFNELLHGKRNENEAADFLVINKQVTSQTLGKKELSTFSAAEIDSLKKQSFAREVGVLSASNFSVSVESYTDALPFYSDAFFESVPDAFIDLKGKENWGWQPGQRDLPVIIPSFFLDLYNTGMAMTQAGLPQLSLDAVMAIPIKVSIRGNGRSQDFVGHVAGTTDRLNSILIPQSFMDWANANYGYRSAQQPARIVLKTLDPSNPALVKYLDDRDWNTNSDKTRLSKVRTIVNWIVGIVGGIGLVMLLFGLMVFSLFIQVTLASCRPDVELLQTLGASPAQLQRFLMRQFMPVNAAIVAVVLVLVVALQFVMHHTLQQAGMFVPLYISWATLLAAAATIAVFWVSNRRTIERFIRS